MKKKPLLVINASGRVTRSVTRRLTKHFAEGWLARHPNASLVDRDVGTHPPTAITESFIAAAFTPASARTPEMHLELAQSDAMIHELFDAEAIVMGVPMYNFGMPAQLKAFFDQIIRVGRTFNFTGDAENPYQPLIPPKPLVLITSTGTGGYGPGEPYEHLNFLEPHLTSLLHFVGLSNITPVRVDFEEHKGEAFERSLAEAQERLDVILGSSADEVEALGAVAA
ncbi:FMN-dependent NADH-azoreductase [Roseimicrobium gellanilyticum]|uniref:FMN dependent NADH:quinone oxidoreductase n=1 Tax=Roseimicrobium gellanilyticum TaxID=748857 RepID=A0A366H0D2_9BACT|nr:NAD(P)H-dependent oxidoreductase [Roseimicrobium gellanilyticum]RBP35305.1 FMN-dependent NADH-azoreductase [Roseimicrobium gellanilyticum]